MPAACNPSAPVMRTMNSRSKTPLSILCRACASPGGGCQFLGTAATSQVVGEALGIEPHPLRACAFRPARVARYGPPFRPSLAQDGIDGGPPHGRHPHRCLAPQRHGRPRGVRRLHEPHPPHPRHRPCRQDSADPLSTTGPASIAKSRASSTPSPTARNTSPPCRFPSAGGVPEVMLHLRRAGLLELNAMTVAGETLGTMLDWWEQSERRHEVRRHLLGNDGVDPDEVIMGPDLARSRGLTSTVTFPKGNLAPGGSSSNPPPSTPVLSMPMTPTASAAPPASSAPKAMSSPPLRAKAKTPSARRHHRPHLPRTPWALAWKRSTR
jgi:hypothetical protein